MTRRLLAIFALLAVMALPISVEAQASKDPVADAMPAPPPAEDNSGSPLYGYLAFGALAGVGVMVLCRSSRRS